MPPDMISRYKPFENLPFPVFNDITRGVVHLDVRWIDQSTNVTSGL